MLKIVFVDVFVTKFAFFFNTVLRPVRFIRFLFFNGVIIVRPMSKNTSISKSWYHVFRKRKRVINYLVLLPVLRPPVGFCERQVHFQKRKRDANIGITDTNWV